MTTDTITDAREAQDATRRLWLVRHGLTEWNAEQRFCGQSDIPLAPEGRQQANWLARRLHTEKLGAIYTSDLLRARETAELIAGTREQPLPIRAAAAWREIDFGAWDGLTYAEIAARFPDQLGFFTNPENHSPPNGEPLLQMRQRVLIALEQVMEENTSNIVIVSHGGPLRVLLCSVLGMSLGRQWQLALAPGSLSALDLLPMTDPLAPLGTLALLNERDASSIP